MTDETAVLQEAYHVLFDLKDSVPTIEGFGYAERAQDQRAELFDALRALKQVMRTYGIEVPHRFDGDGRTVENGGIAAVITNCHE